MSHGRASDRPPGSRLPPDGASPSEWNAEEADLLRGLFLDEAQEHLRHVTLAQQRLARAAGSGESDGAVREAGDTLLRHLHTLKGAAGSVGLDAIARAVHDFEGLCAELRDGALAPTPGILERLDEEVSGLRALLDGARVSPAGARTTAGPAATGAGPGGNRRGSSDRRGGLERRTGERTVAVDSSRLDALLDGVGDLVIVRTRFERRLRELEAVLRDLNATRGSLRSLAGLLEAGSAGGAVAGDPFEVSQGVATAAALDRLAEVELTFADAVAHLDRAARGLDGETDGLRRTSTALEEELRRARLVPLDAAFSRLAPALREFELSARRQAELVVSGGEIAVDKSLIEQIVDPLLHLLRNALAHGIEPAEERVAAGKSERGRIEVSAHQEGEFVFIRFEDDGRGIDRDLVRRALVRRGRLAPDAPLKKEKLLSVLFEPGFSSRPEADELAGRGMGLNIVKRAIVGLGGEVSVDYRPGAGTRFRLAVPLQAAITEALLFKVGGQVYAVPASHVVQVLPLGPDALLVKDGALEGVALPSPASDTRVPILRLHALLGVEMPPAHRAAALHIRYGGRAFLATCDKIIGPRTIVVRPLGPLLGILPLFAGVTISGAGKAQLVLDLGALADAAYAPGRMPPAGPRRGQPRVLVVDDSRLSRETTARALTAAGFQTVTAEDGWEAWELLGERRFDAVVTDLEMPRLDGFELIGRIRREATLKRLPILVLSSRTAQATRARALASGADVVMAKGPHKKALGEAVAGLVGRGDG